MAVKDIIERCTELYRDLEFNAAKRWKAAGSDRKVMGYMPVYVPEEIIHAAGMMPLGIVGGGDQMEVIHGDAYYQSYICRIPRSTIELGVTGKLDFLDGILFPSICDVIRNLSGMWKMMRPDMYVQYFDVPQNFADGIGGEYYVKELEHLRDEFSALAGRPVGDDAINRSIALYNERRRLVREIYDFRSEAPWKAPTAEVHLLMRAGLVIPVEEHIRMMQGYLAAAREEDRPVRDCCRVVINGSFCEQPPLNLIKTIEMAGCYVVDDDYMLGNRWLLEDLATDGNPLEVLADAFLHHSADTAAKYCPRKEDVGRFLLQSVKDTKAEGVIFSAPSFCDPALLERPMLADRMSEHGIPHISFKYAENSGQMQPIREQAGTFADTLKLWS
ncbi:MAG: Benzoyl-CoA reductase subunit C [Gammaproteobacteria bacterium]|nr:Benzoyl-CoA reductase subunit C [Gammaproteobacteria bacterium]